jgi:RNA polymerase sigma-70 factor (ECF subfamily)
MLSAVGKKTSEARSTLMARGLSSEEANATDARVRPSCVDSGTSSSGRFVPRNWPLERYRELLRLQARQLHLDPRLERRFDGSDLVQETLLRAHLQYDQFHGISESEFIAWLQAILVNVAADEIDKARAGKRDLNREQSIQASADSSARLDPFLVSRQPSPSAIVQRHELLLRIANAVDQLPGDQRDVFVHHHMMGTPVAKIARSLERTEKSVAGLLFRARKTLASLLPGEL